MTAATSAWTSSSFCTSNAWAMANPPPASICAGPPRLLLLPPGKRHPGAAASQLERKGASDPTVRTGHERDFSFNACARWNLEPAAPGRHTNLSA
jgi:hypothetical protein